MAVVDLGFCHVVCSHPESYSPSPLSSPALLQVRPNYIQLFLGRVCHINLLMYCIIIIIIIIITMFLILSFYAFSVKQEVRYQCQELCDRWDRTLPGSARLDIDVLIKQAKSRIKRCKHAHLYDIITIATSTFKPVIIIGCGSPGQISRDELFVVLRQLSGTRCPRQ